MNRIDNKPQYRYTLITNAIGVAVSFAINLPELIALLPFNDNVGLSNAEMMYSNLTVIQVVNEILFTYISILILFYINKKILQLIGVGTSIDVRKILFSAVIVWIASSLLSNGFVFLHKLLGISTIDSMAHIYSHPLRNILISSIVTMSSYLMFQNAVSKRVALENQQLKTENIKNQYEALKNQLNPHMLFNSLNTLYSLIREEPDKAQAYLMQLSKVIRYTLNTEENTEANVICLQEELDYVKSYIYLLQMRYEDNLRFNINIDDRLTNRKIPRMAIQLLLENAVKHNEISSVHPLEVNVSSTSNLSLEIANRMQPRRGEIHSNSIGLHNLNKRYQLLFGKSIEISKSDGIFKVTIPLV